MKKKELGKNFIEKMGRHGEEVKFIAVPPHAREKAREFARVHGGRVYRAAAIGRVRADNTGQILGHGYIVADNPPIDFVYWKNYYGKIPDIKEMTPKERRRYITILGIHVFEKRGHFRRWFRLPCIALGTKTPANIIKTAKGSQHVVDVLLSIEYGVYS